MDKQSKLAAVFGADMVTRQTAVHMADAGMPAKQISYQDDSGYEVIRSCIQKMKSSKADIHGLVSEWIAMERPLLICSVSNDLANAVSNEFMMYMIPAIVMKKPSRTTFIVRECDKDRLNRTLATILFRYGEASMVLNYDLFNTVMAKEKTTATYMKNLTEMQMECIRREWENSSDCKKYAIFRMNQDKWGIGINANELVTADTKTFTESCFLENVLKMSLLTTGEDAELYMEDLRNDVDIDRLASSYFAPSLENSEEVFILDSETSASAIKVDKASVSKIKLTNKGGRWNLRESKPYSLDNEKGVLVYREELGKIAYTRQELVRLATECQFLNANKKKELQAIMMGKRILAHNMYCIYAEHHKQESWFGKRDKVDENVFRFQKEVRNVFECIGRNEEVVEYSNHENNVLFNVISHYNIPKKVFDPALKTFVSVEIGEMGQTKYQGKALASLREQIQYMSESIAKGIPIDVSDLQL